MLKLNAEIFFENNDYKNYQYESIDAVHEILSNFLGAKDIKEYAMNVMVLFKNRKTDYL